LYNGKVARPLALTTALIVSGWRIGYLPKMQTRQDRTRLSEQTRYTFFQQAPNDIFIFRAEESCHFVY
jgi:hypothetical protein